MTVKEKTVDLMMQERAEAAVIFSELYSMYQRNRKKALFFIAFEVWVHGLTFQHMGELKEIKEAIPFIGHILTVIPF